MERQLNNSIVISWLPPADIDEGEVVGYSIKADGEVKETVIGVNRTRAIVSDIHHDKVIDNGMLCVFSCLLHSSQVLAFLNEVLHLPF